MKLFYKPFAIFAHQIAARIGRAAFATIWEKVGSGAAPPAPTAGRVGLPRLAVATALEAATMAATAAVADQLAARVFHHLLGAWPTRPPATSEPGGGAGAAGAAAAAIATAE